MSAQQSVADESLLYGNAERRQEPGYEDNGLQGQQEHYGSGSASASAHVEQLQFAPPPPPMLHPLRAETGRWAALNTGVENVDGTQSVDMGFNLVNNQYTGNAPQSPAGTTVMGRSASSMEWETVAAPSDNPGVAPAMMGTVGCLLYTSPSPRDRG